MDKTTLEKIACVGVFQPGDFDDDEDIDAGEGTVTVLDPQALASAVEDNAPDGKRGVTFGQRKG